MKQRQTRRPSLSSVLHPDTHSMYTPSTSTTHSDTNIALCSPYQGLFQPLSVVTLSSAAWHHGTSYVNDIFSLNPQLLSIMPLHFSKWHYSQKPNPIPLDTAWSLAVTVLFCKELDYNTRSVTRTVLILQDDYRWNISLALLMWQFQSPVWQCRYLWCGWTFCVWRQHCHCQL